MKKFKIYFGRYKSKSDYIDVFIYKNQEEYCKHARKIEGFETAAQTFIKVKHDGKNVGRIIFDESIISPAIVYHELQHASIHYWRFHKDRKMSDILKYEEDFCDIIAWLSHWVNIELSDALEF